MLHHEDLLGAAEVKLALLVSHPLEVQVDFEPLRVVEDPFVDLAPGEARLSHGLLLDLLGQRAFPPVKQVPQIISLPTIFCCLFTVQVSVWLV